MPFIKALPTRPAALMVVLALSVAGAGAQTVVKPPKNRYTPQQDVELGREAAAEVRKQYPIISDERITSYLSRLGERLVAAAPPELNEKVYQVLLHAGELERDQRVRTARRADVRAPGHVRRGGGRGRSRRRDGTRALARVAAAWDGQRVEGAEPVAATRPARWRRWRRGRRRISRRRDRAGQPVRARHPAAEVQPRVQKQADLLGAQIMARAGYDPRQLARMFETIERESKSSGGSGPQWMSSHPNPGNRTVYITREAEMLTLGTPADQSGFQPIKAAFAAMPPAKSMAEVERGRGGSGGGQQGTQSVGTPGQPVPPPASQYRTMNGGRIFKPTSRRTGPVCRRTAQSRLSRRTATDR